MFKFKRSPTELEERRSEQLAGVGADTLLRVLQPLIERRLEGLLIELKDAEPALNTLLNLRAQIGEVMRIKQELEYLKTRGREASEVVQEIFNESSN